MLLGSNSYGPFNIHLTCSLLSSSTFTPDIKMRLWHTQGNWISLSLTQMPNGSFTSYKADSKHLILLVVHPQVSHILLVFYNQSCLLAVCFVAVLELALCLCFFT